PAARRRAPRPQRLPDLPPAQELSRDARHPHRPGEQQAPGGGPFLGLEAGRRRVSGEAVQVRRTAGERPPAACHVLKEEPMRSRSRMLAMGSLWGALALAAAVGSGGCGGKTTTGGSGGAGGTGSAAGSKAPGVPQKLASTLRVVCWRGYITPAVQADFEREFKVRLQIEIVNSNEVVMERLGKGEVWDVWTPSDYAVHMASERGLLAPLHHEHIPNLANIGRRFQNAIFDREFRYSAPYYWGTTGWGYDKTVFPEPPATWNYVFDPALRASKHGKIGLLDDMREVIAIALIHLGIDPNSTDPEHLRKARDLLLAARGDMNGFESEHYKDKLTSGAVVMQQGWSGDLNQVLKADPRKGFVLPREGYLMFVDTWAVPKGSPNQETAEVFI